MKILKKLSSLVAVVSLSSVMAAPSSASVINLALLIDGSGSITTSNYALQLAGYEAAFTDSDFFSSVVGESVYQTLNVAVWQFSNTAVSEVGWTAINNQTQSNDFGALFNTTVMPQLDAFTNTEAAIEAATASLLGLDFNVGDKNVIDISTDGLPNRCGSTSCSSDADARAAAISAADIARAGDITVNAVGVGNNIGTSFLTALVSGSPPGFFVTASSFETFGTAIANKLEREISGEPIPTPATLALFGIGLAGLGWSKRKKA